MLVSRVGAPSLDAALRAMSAHGFAVFGVTTIWRDHRLHILIEFAGPHGRDLARLLKEVGRLPAVDAVQTVLASPCPGDLAAVTAFDRHICEKLAS